MLRAFADLATRRPRRVLLGALVAMLLGGAFGGPVAGLLSTGDDFSDPDAESTRAEERIVAATGVETAPGVIALVRPGDQVTGAPARERVGEVTRTLERDPAVARTFGFLDTGDRSFVSSDGRATYVAAVLRADADEEDAVERLEGAFEESADVQLGGAAVANPEVGEQVSEDLARAELLAFPILLLLSFAVFRSVVAGFLPINVGILNVLLTFLAMRLVNEGLFLSIYALNLATALGLGLAIDYSLFVVSRYREEMARSGPGREAMRRTLATAGRTVLFSSITVAAALLSLCVFPQRFLYSMGIGGALTALVAAAVSLTVLPAMLALLGPRVNALALGRWRRSAEAEARGEERGFWYRLSRAVMRRPGAVAIATALLLVVAGLPFLRIEFTGVDASVLPESSNARQVDDAIEREFPPSRTAPVTVLVEAPRAEAGAVRAYATELGELPGVAGVGPPRPLSEGMWQVDVTPRERALDESTRALVRDIRAGPAPGPLAVTGESAGFVDQQAALGDRLPLALAILATTTLLILFFMIGSVLLPLKSLLMNLLGLCAAFGLLVLVFQDGRLEGLLDYTSQGAIESTQPLVLLAVAFGLSTDYGVFLLTRIKEAREAGASNEEAVAQGLQRTGRIVTAAALLFSVALGAFATSELVFIKLVGLGTVAAVLIDATIVRGLLVPALMKLLGDWNWWAPGPLRRLHDRYGLRESANA